MWVVLLMSMLFMFPYPRFNGGTFLVHFCSYLHLPSHALLPSPSPFPLPSSSTKNSFFPYIESANQDPFYILAIRTKKKTLAAWRVNPLGDKSHLAGYWTEEVKRIGKNEIDTTLSSVDGHFGGGRAMCSTRLEVTLARIIITKLRTSLEEAHDGRQRTKEHWLVVAKWHK